MSVVSSTSLTDTPSQREQGNIEIRMAGTKAAASVPSQRQIKGSVNTLVHNYRTTVPARVKLIDAFLLFFIITGVTIFAYRLVITSHPFNAFVGG